MVNVLLADGSEESVEADTWTITPEVGLKMVTVDGDQQKIVAEYHPRFWVRVHQDGAVRRAPLDGGDDADKETETDKRVNPFGG